MTSFAVVPENFILTLVHKCFYCIKLKQWGQLYKLEFFITVMLSLLGKPGAYILKISLKCQYASIREVILKNLPILKVLWKKPSHLFLCANKWELSWAILWIRAQSVYTGWKTTGWSSLMHDFSSSLEIKEPSQIKKNIYLRQEQLLLIVCQLVLYRIKDIKMQFWQELW